LDEKWKEYTIGQIAKIVGGGTPSTKNPEFWDGKIPWLIPKDLSNYKFKYISKGHRNITELGLKRSSAKLLPKGTVLFTSRATIGNIAIANNKISTNQGFRNLICNEEIAFNEFIFYLLKYKTPEIERIASGSTYKEISGSKLKEVVILLPSVNIQKKIAKILSNFDDLIENNLRRIKLLEEIAQLIYHEWFVNYRFPGHESVPLVDSGTDFGFIPEGWKVKKLSNLVKTQYGYTQSASKVEIGPKFVRGTDINKTSYINWSTVPYCKISETEMSKFKLKKGDILIIRMANPGKSGIIEHSINAIFASYLIKLEIIEDLSPYYLFYFLQSEDYQKYIEIAATGTTRKSASANVLTNINILIPNKKVQTKFENIICILRKLLNNLVLKNEKLRLIRDLLLPKLISGQIDVSELDIKICEEEKNV